MIKNDPELWLKRWPQPQAGNHKYHRGHAVILASNSMTGATRLATEACSYFGAGLVSVLVFERGDVYRTCLPADIMVADKETGVPETCSVLLAGPGGMPAGNSAAKDLLLKAPHLVLDANAILAALELDILNGNFILTPHDGEFEKAFPGISGTRIEKAEKASLETGATIVLKGSETIIAAPNHATVVNTHATPYLAKAGTGDVLVGMIAALVAQKMSLFDAACAAVWCHGEAGRRLGPGLIASNLPAQLPGVIADILIRRQSVS